MRLRSFPALFIIVILVVLSACGKNDSADNSSTLGTPSGENVKAGDQATGKFSLMYCSNDTLNPYTTVTKINQELTQLLFDPLIKLDNKFKPVYVLAENINLNKKSCIIKLKNAKFSDDSAVSARDVVFSIQKARESSTKYSEQLQNIDSVVMWDDLTVSIKLKKNDPYFINLLDLPIIKYNSDNLKSKDNVALPPIGCGRYTINLDSKVLSANTSYHGGKVNISDIQLVDTPDSEASRHNIEVGSLSMYYSDLSDNTLPKMIGKSLSVPLNNLVFLGVNHKRAILAIPEIRQAISSGMNRSNFSESAYFGYATPATGPFHSAWKDAEGMQMLGIEQNVDVAVANLNKIGYNNQDNDGYVLGKNGKRLKLSLLCNNNNTARVSLANSIAESLKDIGIEIKVVSVDWNKYQSYLNSGNFDLYIGEVRLQNNMDISQLVTPGGSSAYGIIAPKILDETDVSDNTSENSVSSENDETVGQNTENRNTESSNFNEENQQPKKPLTSAELVAEFYAGNAMLSEVLSTFMAELPIIPICHRSGLMTYSSQLEIGPQTTTSDLFFGIESCSVK